MAQTTFKPRFIDPAGDSRAGSLPVRPPFRFSGVTSRVFPLKANMATLTGFVDAYVNMDIPPEIVHYRPALPYVYLMVLDYGSMSSASQHAQNVGWVSQHEVAFTVPLEIWRMEQGQLVFKDWACVSPFIFVDDEMSLTTGREVYGWPKVAGRVDATKPMWDRHPMSGTRMFTFSTHVFPKVYSGAAENPEVLLQIDTDPLVAFTEFPPNPANKWAPWAAVSEAARSAMTLAGNAVDMALALRVRGYRTNRNPTTLRAMAGRAAGYALEMGPAFISSLLGGGGRKPGDLQGQPSLAFDNITIKQFRDAQEPDRACYKALVRSRMGIERINRSGLLGDTALLRGDTSGGYTIRVHRYTSQPIIESLGIEVARTEKPGEGAEVSVLKPTFPFWTDVDLFYGAGDVVCSRTHVQFDGNGEADRWIDEQGDAPVPVGAAAALTARPAPADGTPGAAPAPAPLDIPTASAGAGYVQDIPSAGAETVPREACYDFYNTALSAATQPMAGPFHFPDVTIQVYPLLADREKLDRFVQQYLNETLRDAGLRFETMGSYAYLLVQVSGDQMGTMWSSSNNIGWWAEREAQFCVPVRWFRTNDDGAEELVSVALVAPFVYSSNGRAVITDREVNGRPSVQADIDSPKDVWLDSSGPAKERKYLNLATEVFPALGYGQKAEKRTLLEIDGGDVLSWYDDVGWRMVREHWGKDLVEELARKAQLQEQQAEELETARALALEILGHGAPINWLVLKQYRDGEDVERACYQALVHTTRTVTRIFDMREIDNRIHVRVHRYPGHPIVETLGLKLKTLDSANGEVVQNLQPLRPFWMRISMQEQLARIVTVRTVDGSWQLAHPWFQPVGPAGQLPERSYFATPGHARVGLGWAQRPQALAKQATQSLRESLSHSFTGAQAAWQTLPEEQRNGLWAQMEAADSALWQQLLAASSPGQFSEGQKLEALQLLERRLAQAGLQWEPSVPDLTRLTRAQAQDTIRALGDVQVVLDRILSEEWENWGNPRWYQNLPPLPTPGAPKDSLSTKDGLGLKALLPARPAPPKSMASADAPADPFKLGDWCFVPATPAPAEPPADAASRFSSSSRTGTRPRRRST